jgi:hypothetical protein
LCVHGGRWEIWGRLGRGFGILGCQRLRPFRNVSFSEAPIGDEFDDEMKQGDRSRVGDLSGRSIHKKPQKEQEREGFDDAQAPTAAAYRYPTQWSSSMYQYHQNARSEVEEGAYIHGEENNGVLAKSHS